MLTTTPALVVFAITSLVLVAHLLFVWAWSGIARGSVKATTNAEDTSHGATLVDVEPPGIARILRVHANAEAHVYPFLITALVYVLLGGGVTLLEICCATFVAARLLYVVVYLRGMQPWRTIMFVIGLLAQAVLFGDIVYLLLLRR